MSSDRSESKSQKSEFKRPGPDGAVKLCYICINAKTGRLKPKTRPRAVCLSRHPGINHPAKPRISLFSLGFYISMLRLQRPAGAMLCKFVNYLRWQIAHKAVDQFPLTDEANRWDNVDNETSTARSHICSKRKTQAANSFEALSQMPTIC